MLTSCSAARYVPEGEYLISKNRMSTKQKSISEDQLKSYIIQRPNKRILGIRFYLFLYNLSNINKDKWPHNWLREIGEEPEIYDSGKTNYSAQQIAQFLENKGYYHAVVKDTVKFRGKNAKVHYNVELNKPYRVAKITYFFEDTGLVSHVLPDTLNSLLGKGMRFDKDILQNERVRIETMLKEAGYFNFSKEYIFYDATFNEENYTVDLVMNIKEYIAGEADPRTKVKNHQQYQIGNVFIYPNHLQMNAGDDTASRQIIYDTVNYRGQRLLYTGKKNLKPGVIVNSSYIIPGQMYKLSDVNKSYKNLSQLGIIRYTNITFGESDSIGPPGSHRLLDCKIELSQKKVQSIQPEISGTNSAGDLGIRGNLQYQNLNLFRGAEVFNLRFNGAIEALQNRSENKYSSMKEFGTELSITFPKFL
jgi:outer membrane protein assembly factor BamA